MSALQILSCVYLAILHKLTKQCHIVPANANCKLLVRDQHDLHMQTQRPGWSSRIYTHPPQDFVK